MAFSVFSQPLSSARMSGYGWGGATVGAGAGAILAGRDHRTSGAIVGGIAGNIAGMGVAGFHAYGHNAPDVIDNLTRGAKDLTGGRMSSAGLWAKYAGIKAGRNPNVTSELSTLAGEASTEVRGAISKVAGIMGRFHRG